MLPSQGTERGSSDMGLHSEFSIQVVRERVSPVGHTWPHGHTWSQAGS